MFAEMHAFSLVYPRLPPDQILAMATRNPARAVGLAGRLGEISPGAHADLIAVPCDNIADPYEAVVFAEQPVRWAMVAGKIVRS
ncbi:MAG: amidohydrolase family protein, partial [Verrucomicrobiae bacterium]|nr:amidohydrolase family protein [Verrucomicrobiae bacterium]